MEGTRGGIKRYSVPEAAELLSITPRAVRKRIAAGTLVAEREGGRWWILLPAAPTPEPREPETGTGSPDAEPGAGTGPVPNGTERNPEAPTEEPLGDLVQLLRDLQRQNLELAGQVGYLQGIIHERDEQIRLLQAPPDEPPEEELMPEDPEPRRGWWRRLLG